MNLSSHHLPSVICYLPFVICHLSSAINQMRNITATVARSPEVFQSPDS